MNKADTLKALENAKKLHITQMGKIEVLLGGQMVDNPTAIGKMECECGKLFYGNKETMLPILGAQLYERLDKLHEKWHIDYAKIYNIFFKKEEKGFFSKLLGSNKVNPLELDKAKLYYAELNETTKQLLNVADAATRRVGALNEAKFKS